MTWNFVVLINIKYLTGKMAEMERSVRDSSDKGAGDFVIFHTFHCVLGGFDVKIPFN